MIPKKWKLLTNHNNYILPDKFYNKKYRTSNLENCKELGDLKRKNSKINYSSKIESKLKIKIKQKFKV